MNPLSVGPSVRDTTPAAIWLACRSHRRLAHRTPATDARSPGAISSQGGGLKLRSGYALPPFQATASRLTLIDAPVSSCLYGRLPMARPIWHVWRAGCSFISGLLVQVFVLLALMESADPHLICRPSLLFGTWVARRSAR